MAGKSKNITQTSSKLNSVNMVPTARNLIAHTITVTMTDKFHWPNGSDFFQRLESAHSIQTGTWAAMERI